MIVPPPPDALPQDEYESIRATYRTLGLVVTNGTSFLTVVVVVSGRGAGSYSGFMPFGMGADGMDNGSADGARVGSDPGAVTGS